MEAILKVFTVKEGWDDLLFWWKEYWWLLFVKSCFEGITEGLGYRRSGF